MLQVATREGVLTITFDRPDKFNAFNRELAMGVQEALRLAAQLLIQRCVVWSSLVQAKPFVQARTLGEAIAEDGPTLRDIVAKHYNPIIKAIRELPKPVIAAVNGVAAGAGANIALACDIVIAHEKASFVQAFSKIGLIPDSGGTFTLPRLVGFQHASALMMTGDKVPAAQAQRMGMVYQVFPEEDYEGEVAALALRMAQMPTKGLALTKRALNARQRMISTRNWTLEEALQTKAGKNIRFQRRCTGIFRKTRTGF